MNEPAAPAEQEQLPAKKPPLAILTRPKDTIPDFLNRVVIPNSEMLDRVKLPGKDGTLWTVPTLRGPQTKAELDGVVVAARNGRVLWPHRFGKGPKGRPSCTSEDGIKGVGDPGGACAKCPKNEWGSDPEGGQGKACKEVCIVYVLQAQAFVPIVLPLPVMSIEEAQKYFFRLYAEGYEPHQVLTRWTIRTATNAQGVPYPQAAPALLRELTPEERAVTSIYSATLQASLRVGVGPEDYVVNGDDPVVHGERLTDIVGEASVPPAGTPTNGAKAPQPAAQTNGAAGPTAAPEVWNTWNQVRAKLHPDQLVEIRKTLGVDTITPRLPTETIARAIEIAEALAK